MRISSLFLALISLSAIMTGCTQPKQTASQTVHTLFSDVTKTHLPYADLQQLSMDAAVADFDQDGDFDILIANEHRPNILLINDGTGHFTNESTRRIPQVAHDSEDIGVADFDLDGDPDILIVSEDDQTNELYLNNGDGTFSDGGHRILVTGTSNSVVIIDINKDAAPDILIGNNGQNYALINDGNGYFVDESISRLGAFNDVTQDLTTADLDGDGDLDLLVGNEDANRILINNGEGYFEDQSAQRLPYRDSPEETREVDVADIDGDGDLDVLFGNVQAFVENAERQNRLLLNGGKGFFSDITSTHLPKDDNRCFGVAFLDIDQDDDVDIITGNTNGPRFDGLTPFSIYLNDGKGVFVEANVPILPDPVKGRGFDIDVADFNGDGLNDLFLSNRGSQDFLLFGTKQ